MSKVEVEVEDKNKEVSIVLQQFHTVVDKVKEYMNKQLFFQIKQNEKGNFFIQFISD